MNQPSVPDKPLGPAVDAPAAPPLIIRATSTGRAALGAGLLALALVVSTVVAAGTLERIKTRPAVRTLEVTGSAKRRIVSDLAQWTATVETEDPDRTAAYRLLHTHVDQVAAHLRALGIGEVELRVGSATFRELTNTEVVGSGYERRERQVFAGYRTEQSLTVVSANVALVERASREITQLLEQGITITSGEPKYFYTRLGELKIEMLAEASKDARARASNMVGSAGGATLGRLRTADMGVINVNSANGTESTWDGNNDTTSIDKDILTIVHATYDLQ
ncbi:MAG: SIMPL domain-containing protein [Kofleriaceae bacterium]